MSYKTMPKILIVEDEAITAMDLESILQKLGYEVISIASTGEEAIKKSEELEPDLVLMDIVLKGHMDGINAAKEIQSCFDIPVIYLTAYSDKNTLKRARSTKPYGFLTKPVSPDGLEASIETALYNYDLDKKLMESEEKYRRIVETANEGIWAIDENFKTTFVNQRMAEMLGYTAPEMIGMQFTFFMFEEDLKEYDVKSEPQGFPERFECKFKHKDGSEIWAKVSSTPLKDESGSFAMFTDITKEKRMENTLKESEELYKMLFENSNVCTAITTMNGNVINANHNFFEMTGYHPEEINQINWGNMYQNIDQRNDLIEILKKEGKARDYEVKMIRNDNQPYVASINVDLILYHHEDAMLVTAIDITEQKKSQIALECSESRLRELFNNMSSGVAVYDVINNSSDFIFKDFNKAAERIENLRKDDVIGKNVLETFPGIKDFGLFAVLQRVWRTGIAEHFPTSFYKDQRIIGWRDNYIYKLPSGEIVAVYDDVTEQMNAEEALKESEEKYRQVFNKANDMISLNLMNGDMPGNFIEINNIGVQRLGYSKEELLNMSPKDIVAPDKRSEMPENVRQLNEKGHNTFEIVHITKDGKMIPIEVNNHLISFNGQAVCLAISRDITERKKVEEQIKTERQKLLDIIEFLPNATFVIDEDKNIIAWNKAIEKMTGISKKEMIGKGNHEYSIPFYGIRRPVLIDLIFLEKEKIESEYNLVRKEGNNLFAEVFLKNLFDGRGAYVFVKASPLYDDNGNIVGAIESIRDITERKEIEQDLKESEEKYRWLFEASPLYLILVGLDGRLMDVNQAACDFVGTSKEDLICKHFSELGIMPEEELPLHYDNISRILKGEEIEPYESRYIDKNGKIHFAITHESPIKKDGKVFAFQIICVDTTESKKMEEALKEEKEFAENLIETANVIVLGLDPEGKVNIFNSAAEEITGYSSEEVLGNSFELILPRERYGYVWSKFYNLMEGGMPKYFENPILTKSGEERFITWQNNELYKDGQIIGSISFGMDVTERKDAEKALLESEKKYRDLIELLPQPVYESDLDGNITFANRVGLEIFGYTREDMDKGLNMAQILSPEDYLKAIEDVQKTLDGEELVAEYMALKKDGTTFPVVVYANPIIHENKITGSRGIVIDITEFKRQEQELEHINKNLMVSEERFRALIDNTTSIIRILDKDGLIVFDSPSSSRILGYPEGYFIGKNPIDFIHPQDRQNVKDAIKEVFEYRNDGIPTEFRIKKADGTYHPFESIAQNLTGEPGIEGILIVTNSIFRRKKYEDKIKKSLKEKNVLLQEIHHRVKNNMQIISSLLNLQKEHVNSGEAINVLQESQNRVKSMALIHEKLYKSDNLMNINLKDYIQDLITDLFHSYGVSKEEVVPICDMEDIMLNVETAIPCGLIVSELVSNSLKYAFPPNIREFQEKKGEIFVGLKSVGDFIQLRIYDNGIGFPEGRDYNDLDTLGLRLVNVLVNQIDGQIELDNINGVDFKVKFKELKYKERF